MVNIEIPTIWMVAKERDQRVYLQSSLLFCQKLRHHHHHHHPVDNRKWKQRTYYEQGQHGSTWMGIQCPGEANVSVEKVLLPINRNAIFH